VCCDQPVRILLAPEFSAAAREIVSQDHDSDAQAVRRANGYLAAIVAKHPSHNLINAIEANSR
jgi:hypothetical protein